MRVTLLSSLLILLTASLAHAQTGASDDRVSLPEGPGSLEGVGENVNINANMGSMRYGVGIKVPAGFGGVTPSLSLSYDSGGGGSVVGMGWSMMTPCIERMTYRGLPEYDTEDDFAADGSNQLVALPGTNPPVYRARFEGGFVRYVWLGQGDGAEGFWLAEYPDGSRGYFGADSQGNFVDNARVSGDEGTFRYHLVEMIDVFGHRMRYSYTKDGHVSLVSHIGYVFTQGLDQPTYEVTFDYEERRDETGVDYLSDAKAGFNELLTQRLTDVHVLSRGQEIRRYALGYEPYENTGGFTRLRQVETFGADGGRFPIAFTFDYSQSFGGESPYMMEMGELGVAFGAGRATLLDINGDGLPDIVDSTLEGPHRIYYNIAAADGTSAFETTPIFSAVGRQNTHLLGQASVQVLDLNGDGFTDLINAFTGEVLINQGSGDWERADENSNMAALAGALLDDFDADEGELETMKFIDYDNDKKIDAMRSTQFQTTVFRNLGDDGFEVDEQVEQLGVGFAEDGLQFADMNGDGLLDVVRVQPSTISYKINLGWGRWSDYVTIGGLPISETQVELAELEDLNGDGLADLVVVVGDSVTVALNTNTTHFSPAMVFESNDVEGIIPIRDSGTTVLFADMNANGSSDIVWISPGGNVQALELFPVRPNLMTRVTNGIGQVAEVTYTTSAAQMARDGGWENQRYRLPYPMNIVQKLSQYELIHELHEETEYQYHDGFYDGVEKQFRGFERVEIVGKGDDFIEEGLVELRYDLGVEDIYRKGLLLSSQTTSDGRALSLRETTYEDCPVAEIPQGTDLPIRFVCPTRTRTTVKEGSPQSDWVVTETFQQYDGYGNVTLEANLGVTSVGGAGCEPCGDRGPDDFGVPCGDQCLGDEFYAETEYVSPLTSTDGRWIIHAPFQMRQYGRPDSPLYREVLTYYDGPDFIGLPLGQLNQGKATRVTTKADAESERVIERERYRFDDHGRIIEALDPLGVPGGTTHRITSVYDADNLRIVQQDKMLEDPSGRPYSLRQSMTYEPRFDKLDTASAWRVFEDNAPIADDERLSHFEYDQFGRLISTSRPGDAPNDPSDTFTYELQSPVSRIIARRRVEEGSSERLESITCLDGRGRNFQTRTRLADDLYQVSGFQVFNVQSSPLLIYQPYQSDNDRCDLAPPQGTRFAQLRYDASSRMIRMLYPDEDIYGTASEVRNTFAPLATIVTDASDNDPDSPQADTPVREEINGLGHTIAKERWLSPNAPPERMTFQYDSLGRVLSYLDQQNNLKEQTYDLLDRVLSVTDPNSLAVMTYDYDDASNTVRSMDARGIIVNVDFDGLNRPTAQWEDGRREETLVTFRYDKAPEGCQTTQCTHTPKRVTETTWPGIDGQRGAEQMGYDARGRAVYRSWQMGTQRLEWTSEYDIAGRATAVQHPDGRRIETQYDGLDRPVQVQGLFESLRYSARGLLAETQGANGTNTVWRRDGLMRMVGKETRADSGVLLQGFEYTHNRVGQILAIEDTSELPGISYEARYDYDGRTRMIEADMGIDGPNPETLTYTYDSIDNLTARRSSLGTSSPMHTETHAYDGAMPNAVTQVGALALDYDDAGQVLQYGDDQYTWDHLGRLVSTARGDDEITHRYGSLGRRVMRQHDGSTSLYPQSRYIIRDGISELYVHAGSSIARLESDALATAVVGDPLADGQVNSADAWQSHVQGDDPRPFLWSSVRRLLLETGPEDGVTWLHTDHLGSHVMATAQRGGQTSVEGRRSFFPYGAERAHEGFVDAFGFTGREHDPDGTIHFRMRQYHPTLGRWLSPDPAFRTINSKSSADGTVAYAYVMNDPINAIDASGLNTVYIALGFSLDKNDVQSDVYLANMKDAFNEAAPSRLVRRTDQNGQNTIVREFTTENAAFSLRKGTKNSGIGQHVDSNGTTTIVLGAHGIMDSSGMGTEEEQFNTDQMAELLVENGLDPDADNGNLVFKLHGCNTGACSKIYNSKNSESVATRFVTSLKKAGFKKFKVIGYNGFIVSIGVAANKANINPDTGHASPDGKTHDPNTGNNFVEYTTTPTQMGGTRTTKTGGKKKSMDYAKSLTGKKNTSKAVVK